MIRVAIVEDDAEVQGVLQEYVRRYTRQYGTEFEVTLFADGVDILDDYRAVYDIIFLDVLMPAQNGISTAMEIRQYDTSVKIIYLTSSAEYAVDSYSVGAYFYQLKPIWQESFYRLMDSVLSECHKDKENSLILRSRTGITRLDLDRLQYCEVMGRTLLFHRKDGEVLDSIGRLDDLCEQLKDYEQFVRCHRSYLINMDYVQNISSKAITMTDGIQIPIPHGKYSELKDKFFDYFFRKNQTFLA